MSPEPFRLAELIESIADGRPVDWDACGAGADGDRQRVLGHLRLVANIADVHRTVHASDGPASEAMTIPVVPPPALATWGHLVLLEKIGEGAFGEVFRARDSWLDHEVALKILKPAAHASVAASRALDEARALARVRHSNVVCVHGADMHDGRLGLWMELVRGRTLGQIVAAQGPFGAPEAAVIGQDICRALAAVHAEGLVHRDVKVQNVMRASGGRIVLMDFGSGHTPIYLAPEVLAGAEATCGTDLYALGVLLYFLVTNEFPVQAATVDRLRAAHSRGDRRRLADRRPDLPNDFVAVVERAIEPDALSRYQSAGAMLDALAHLGTASARHETAALPRRRWRLSTTALVTAALLVVATTATVVYQRSFSPVAAVPRWDGAPIIAIMPLEGAGADVYFGEGMTEALMQSLSGLRTVRVVSRTSVDRARAQARTLPEIARALNANAILEGSVQHDAGVARINLRLIHAGSDTPVWSRSFSEPLDNVFALQQHVAEAVAAEWSVSAPLISRIAGQFLRGRTGVEAQAPQVINPAAYDAYLRGRYEFNRRTLPGVQTALQHFQRALDVEPRFARALAGMAECYLMLGADFLLLPLPEAHRLGTDAASRALALDETLADAAATLAVFKFEFDWDFAGAEREFRRAIESNPSLVGPRENFAMFLASRGRFDEAFTQLAAARAVDPLSALVAERSAAARYYARQYEAALADVERAIQLAPEAVSARVGRARILDAMGRHVEAIAAFEQASQSAAAPPFLQAAIAQAELAAGRNESAMRRIHGLEQEASQPQSRVSPYMMALTQARLDRDVAFTWLDREFDRKGGALLWMTVDPRVDPLRDDPRFAVFVERLGLVR